VDLGNSMTARKPLAPSVPRWLHPIGLEVNQPERILILNLLSTQWDVANEERMKTEPNSMDELWFLERQALIEGLQRKLV
jgi:hypothetical protein